MCILNPAKKSWRCESSYLSLVVLDKIQFGFWPIRGHEMSFGPIRVQKTLTHTITHSQAEFAAYWLWLRLCKICLNSAFANSWQHIRFFADNFVDCFLWILKYHVEVINKGPILVATKVSPDLISLCGWSRKAFQRNFIFCMGKLTLFHSGKKRSNFQWEIKSEQFPSWLLFGVHKNRKEEVICRHSLPNRNVSSILEQLSSQKDIW